MDHSDIDIVPPRREQFTRRPDLTFVWARRGVASGPDDTSVLVFLSVCGAALVDSDPGVLWTFGETPITAPNALFAAMDLVHYHGDEIHIALVTAEELAPDQMAACVRGLTFVDGVIAISEDAPAALLWAATWSKVPDDATQLQIVVEHSGGEAAEEN